MTLENNGCIKRALLFHQIIKIDCKVTRVKVANIGGREEQSVFWSKSEFWVICILKKVTEITLAW